FLKRWAITTLGVVVAATLVRGIDYSSFGGLLAASLLLGALNAFLKPVMLILALPLLVASLGIFVLFVNAFLLFAVGQLMGGAFRVDSFGAAFWGGVVISLVSITANILTGTRGAFRIQRHRSPPPDDNRRPPTPPPGDGPVIDV
ncbi:MAG: phage holin family protein, partial [Verrucomicrobiae bacterium]|nr:phage holin family protein [Verrucomicrobiae bacterium]